MVDQKHTEGRCQSETNIEGKEEVAEALSTVGFRTDIGDEGGG